jgi:hypothetical protein
VSVVAIEIKAPGGSYVDYTNSAVFQECSLTQNMNAVAGEFSIKMRDPDRTLSFVTGSEIRLTIDSSVAFAGYITQISMGSFAPAADTSNLSQYNLRTWTLVGTDYNIIFDRRVLRNTSDYLTAINLTDTEDGAILRNLVDNYTDCSDFSSSGILDLMVATGDVWQQGTKLRDPFDNWAALSGAVWYIDPTRTFVYTPYESVEKRWGFSDAPNHTPITVSPATYQGATYGFNTVEGSEDGSFIINDALIWGGSEFAGSSGGTVFGRSQDSTSISDHHRWQVGETHFGEFKYHSQTQVDNQADVLVNGPPGTAPDPISGTNVTKGLKFPQWQFTFTWYSDDVPLLSGVPDHIIPGDIVTINLSVFGVTKLLPLRTLRTSFPDAFVNDGTHKVQFDGTFGLQLSDPFTLWRYLLKAQTVAAAKIVAPTVVTASSTSTVYGAQFSDAPTPAADSSTTVFNITFGYITGSTQVYQAGLLLTRGTDYTESDPTTGEITFTVAPTTGVSLWVLASTLSE